MIRPYYQIIVTLIVSITTISTNWVSYKGLWYYISDSNDIRNYMDAEDYCANLNGHLATIVDDNQYNFLMGHTSTTKHWIGLSSIHTKHKQNCNDADMVWAGDYTCAVDYISDPNKIDGVSCSAYTLHKTIYKHDSLTVANCYAQFRFICQWQCHTLGIISNNVSLGTGLYIEQYYQTNRKSYETTSTYTDSGILLQYTKSDLCLVRCIFNRWTFLNGTAHKLYNSGDDHTPYYRERWKQYSSSGFTNVYFACMDCQEYEVTFTNGTTTSTIFVKKRGDYDFTNDNNPSNLRLTFERQSGRWCFTQNAQKHCFKYDITPIGYVSTIFKSHNIQLNISCKTMDRRDDNDITTVPQKTKEITTSKLLTIEPGPEHTTEQEILTTNKPEIISSPAFTMGVPTTSELHSKYSSSHSTNALANTQVHDTRTTTTLTTALNMHSPLTNGFISKQHHLNTNTEPTTILDLYSQTIDPQSVAYQNKQDNLKTSNGNTNMYIGVAVGVVLLIIIAVIIGVALYKRRRASKGNTEIATQNLDDVHVITDTNIYSDPSFIEPPISRIPHVPVRNSLSNLPNTQGTAPHIPPRNHVQAAKHSVTMPDTNADSILQSHNHVGAHGDKAGYHISNTHAYESSNMPIYSEVNKHKKPVPPVPTEPVYSQVSKKARTVNGEHKQDNIQSDVDNGSDSDIEFYDNDVYESKGAPCARTHENTGDNSDEEFSDNELYQRDTSAPAHRQTNVSTNVVDNEAFDNASDDDNIEMVDNDVYGQM